MDNLLDILGEALELNRPGNPDCNCSALGESAPCANGGTCCQKRVSVPAEHDSGIPGQPAEDDDADLFPDGDDPVFSAT